MGGITTQQTRRFLSDEQEFARIPKSIQGKTWDESEYSIDPQMKYPKEYQEFMSPFGNWDYYGMHALAFDDGLISKSEVDEILEKRKQKLEEKKEKELKAIEQRMQQELEMRFKERRISANEVDTTDIDSLFEIYSNLGGLGADAM